MRLSSSHTWNLTFPLPQSPGCWKFYSIHRSGNFQGLCWCWAIGSYIFTKPRREASEENTQDFQQGLEFPASLALEQGHRDSVTGAIKDKGGVMFEIASFSSLLSLKHSVLTWKGRCLPLFWEIQFPRGLNLAHTISFFFFLKTRVAMALVSGPCLLDKSIGNE